ncbi:peptidoglycan-binding protein [Streptomyces sp. NPDC018693]|uniref:peptidoglycan-binding domain-containing protein n=1 Tax=unclassified Streptomyces TaxID=2593676 RepID=UPI0037B908B1
MRRRLGMAVAAVTLGAAGALSVPAVGTATAAPATWASEVSTVRCRLVDFVGWYCGYHIQNTYADRGDRGAKVKEIQALLVLKGFSVGSSGVDGVFGAGTERAVERFQRSRGIGVDGIVGPTTWSYLRTPSA